MNKFIGFSATTTKKSNTFSEFSNKKSSSNEGRMKYKFDGGFLRVMPCLSTIEAPTDDAGYNQIKILSLSLALGENMMY